jgi:AbrB family looped-hinge helix DNA binding protein
MPTLTITAKGQVTLRREVLDHLGLRPGDKVEVGMRPDGSVVLAPARPAQPIAGFFGSARRPGQKRLSQAQIEATIREGWAKRR